MIGIAAALMLAGPAAMAVTPDARDRDRLACAAGRHGHKNAVARAAFKACLERIPFDGDLPPRDALKAE